jgi:hypothetical protein
MIPLSVFLTPITTGLTPLSEWSLGTRGLSPERARELRARLDGLAKARMSR